MSRPVSRILLVFVGLALLGAAGAYFMYNKPHADLSAGAADYALSASELMAEFETDEAGASAKYVDKVVEVRGTVQENTETHGGGRVLMLRDADALTGVSCAFLPEAAASVAGISPGTTLVVRGICSGMLMDVNLSRCVVVK